MTTLMSRIAQYYHILYISVALSISVFLLFMIFPGGSRFGYEFQKNAPWQHETLIAPFDFAIMKTDEAIKAERDSIQKNFIPYFTRDTLIAAVKTGNFEARLHEISGYVPQLTPEIISMLRNDLQLIFDYGITDQPPAALPALKDQTELFVITGRTAERRKVEDLFSLKSAFQNMERSADKLFFGGAQTLAGYINLSDYIQANLSYNEEINDKERNKAIATLSQTRGMVQAGERIVFKGDIVTPEKFQVLTSLKKYYETRQGQNIDRYLLVSGRLIMIVSCLLVLTVYLALFRPEIFRHKRHLSFILLMIIAMVAASRFIISQDLLSIYLIPIAILPVLFRIFFDSRTAIFGLMVTCILAGYFAPNNYEFIYLHLIAGIIAVYSLYNLYRRSHLVKTTIWVLLAYCILYLSFSMVREGNVESIQWTNLLWFAANALLILLAYPLIYIFEKMFGFTSDVTLIELSNTNQPLLRKLAEEAPGTFQHSLQVANLAEAVIHRIGGNPFLAYAGALYHDIGKIKRPEWFIENQAAGMNPHEKTDYRESAKIIIDHVTYGLKLARRHKLPDIITGFIATHHGTTQAKYFYTLYKNEHAGEVIDSTDFTYPGPRPRTKENAVVMLIDGIEAATRTLKDKTHQTIKEFIENMVRQKLEEGQLDDADLTMRDLRIIKETLTEKLTNIYHTRIEYPEERK